MGKPYTERVFAVPNFKLIADGQFKGDCLDCWQGGQQFNAKGGNTKSHDKDCDCECHITTGWVHHFTTLASMGTFL